MWFIGVEVEQETSAPPPKKNPGSAPAPRVGFNCSRLDNSLKQILLLGKVVCMLERVEW